MNLEEQVLSIEQAKHLQELGLDMRDAAIWYVRLIPANDWELIFKTEHCETLFNKSAYHDCYCPTYTLQEMLSKLPNVIEDEYYLVPSHGNIEYSSLKKGILISFDITFFHPIGVYNMLCWVLENGYLKEDAK